MVKKITNKDEKFYQYMGKFFGSRLVQSLTNDRIYDDDNKEWYIYKKDDVVKAFVSIHKDVIKNIYTTNAKYLEEILENVKSENNITYSIVTNYYSEIYEKCGFKINKSGSYKNFVMIYTDAEEASA